MSGLPTRGDSLLFPSVRVKQSKKTETETDVVTKGR